MMNDLDIQAAYGIYHECTIVCRTVMQAETGRTVTSSASLQSSGMKLVHLIGTCVKIVRMLQWTSAVR